MRVLILTEGSSNIGFGHVTRCISLYQAFDERKIVTGFIVNGDKAVCDLLKDINHNVFNWLKDLERLFDLLKETDIAIIDSYLADYDLCKRISDLVKIAVYIDDNRRIDYPDGIVVNGTIYAEEIVYPHRPGITYLLGNIYTPIRRGFWDVSEKIIRRGVETVLIAFGGDDSRNMTPKVLKLLVDNYPEFTKSVIIGKGFQKINEIEKLKDNRTNLMYYPDAERVKNIMLESDIAISAGGQTLYELARIGVPTIAIAVADNQLNNVNGWQKAGFIEYAGWWEDENVLSNIAYKIELLKNPVLREGKAKIGSSMIDGQGAVRIIKYCIERYFSDGLILRKAEIKDMYNIYELSNEPETRQNSFNQEQIELEKHKKWLFNKLNDKDCLFLVAEADGKFLGQARFDINGNEAQISISVKKYRGLGIGKILIQRAVDFLRLKNPEVLYVKSYIKEGNISSVKLFNRANFQFVQSMIFKGQNALEYQYQIKEG